MNLTRTKERGDEGYLQMLKRFITVADCSNEFSGKQLQPQHMPIGKVVTCHNGLSPLNCHSLPEGEV
jgi:hypothetical protein